ncbi:MAG: quinone-dependent dihydroorotate dehydrogenase [Gammaproteobacteria bacterium]|nr:quinone-dependent dihydroorotate dehydrogenase [Gammaproteobacteria bacterium]
MKGYALLRRLLFTLPPELASCVALETLRFLKFLSIVKLNERPIQVMGMTFPNSVGTAAGLDKNGDYIDALASLGFGFLEVGTVTPLPQLGNVKPRLFRLPEHEALINRMGFNNKGVDYLVERIRAAHFKGIVGVNIGKNAATPLANAVEDYLICFRKVYSHASYVVVNVSSPNTKGLRELQFGQPFLSLLSILKAEQKCLWQATRHYTPLVVKISPDLSPVHLAEIAEILLDVQIDGVIATNTTTKREGVEQHPLAKEEGGVSGSPLFSQTLMVIRTLSRLLKGNVPIIACGGIMTSMEAEQCFSAGASLVQIYTGLVYRGPSLIKDIVMPH